MANEQTAEAAETTSSDETQVAEVVLETLSFVYDHLVATDAANAAANLAQVRERPLTRRVRDTHELVASASGIRQGAVESRNDG